MRGYIIILAFLWLLFTGGCGKESVAKEPDTQGNPFLIKESGMEQEKGMEASKRESEPLRQDCELLEKESELFEEESELLDKDSELLEKESELSGKEDAARPNGSEEINENPRVSTTEDESTQEMTSHGSAQKTDTEDHSTQKTNMVDNNTQKPNAQEENKQEKNTEETIENAEKPRQDDNVTQVSNDIKLSETTHVSEDDEKDRNNEDIPPKYVLTTQVEEMSDNLSQGNSINGEAQHDFYEYWWYYPDCVNPGYYSICCHTCDYCEEGTDESRKKPLGHKPDEGTVVVRATCIYPGEIEHHCVVCHAKLESTTLPINPDAHVWAQDEEGVYCELCGKEL